MKKTTARREVKKGNIPPTEWPSAKPEAMETIWISPTEALLVSVGVNSDRSYFTDLRIWDSTRAGMLPSIKGLRIETDFLPKVIKALKRVESVTG